jgi:hypothetical protein
MVNVHNSQSLQKVRRGKASGKGRERERKRKKRRKEGGREGRSEGRIKEKEKVWGGSSSSRVLA